MSKVRGQYVQSPRSEVRSLLDIGRWTDSHKSGARDRNGVRRPETGSRITFFLSPVFCLLFPLSFYAEQAPLAQFIGLCGAIYRL